MKITLRADLMELGYGVPQVNGDQYFSAGEIKGMRFLYQCDVTGQVALENKGELVVLYGIDLDFNA